MSVEKIESNLNGRKKKFIFFPIQSFKQSYLRLKERKNVIKIKTNELLLLLLLLIITKIGTKME